MMLATLPFLACVNNIFAGQMYAPQIAESGKLISQQKQQLLTLNRFAFQVDCFCRKHSPFSASR